MAKRSKKPKKSKAETPLKDRSDVPDPLQPAARSNWTEVVAAEADQSWLREKDAFEKDRYPRIFTGLIDIDMQLAPAVQCLIELSGRAHLGKSTVGYKLCGALLRTCRKCNTFAAAWVDDDTGEVAEVCRCRKNAFMEGAIADIERAAEPVWLDLWGCRTGTGFRESNFKGFKILDPDKQRRLHIVRPISGDAIFTFLSNAIRTGAIDFVLLDSLNDLVPTESLEKPVGGARVADRARMNWDGLRRMLSARNEHAAKFQAKATFIWTNHLISDIGGWGGEVEAGGGAPVIAADQKIRFTSGKVNEGKKELPFDSYRDTFFKVTKNRGGHASGGKGSFRLYINEVSHGRVVYYPGDSDDADRSLELLRAVGLFEQSKSKYRVLGREFSRVQDIKQFLSREDIGLEVRFWLKALGAPTIARAHFDMNDYLYSPFDSARRFHEITAEIVEKKMPGFSLGAALGDRKAARARLPNQGAAAGEQRKGAKEELESIFQ